MNLNNYKGTTSKRKLFITQKSQLITKKIHNLKVFIIIIFISQILNLPFTSYF